MPLAVFISAVLALLVAPGPTNTLMAIAGAQRGFARVGRLLPAELAGYLTSILPLAWLGAHGLAGAPMLAAAVKLVAAGWVMLLALRLWRATAGAGGADDVTARRIYVTTLLNPKALVFGLVLLPAPSDAQFPLRLGLFCLMVAGAALLWGGAGAMTRSGSEQGAGQGRRLQALQRVASVWLAVVSMSLLLGVIRG